MNHLGYCQQSVGFVQAKGAHQTGSCDERNVRVHDSFGPRRCTRCVQNRRYPIGIDLRKPGVPRFRGFQRWNRCVNAPQIRTVCVHFLAERGQLGLAETQLSLGMAQNIGDLGAFSRLLTGTAISPALKQAK